MIAYNTQWLDALRVHMQSRKWFSQQLLSAQQWTAVQSQFPIHFYMPNFFIRTGLFVFCWILVCSVLGLIGSTLLSVMFSSDMAVGSVFLVFGIGLVAGLEYFIRNKNYYRAGIDDALLYMALISLIVGLCLIVSDAFDNSLIGYYLLALPILIVGAIRYTDGLVSGVAYVCLLVLLFLVLEKISFLRSFIPFICMAFAAATYIWAKKSQLREEWRYWLNCLEVLEAASLLTFYLSGNFLVVKGFGEMLFPGYQLPLMFVFYLLTAVVPVAYLFIGVRNKDRLLLRMGLFLIAASVITFKLRFGTEHPEAIITLIGAILTIGVYFIIRVLKKPLWGLTYQVDRTEDPEEYTQLEVLSAVHLTDQATTTPDKGLEFGGGNFGGGGAGGSY